MPTRRDFLRLSALATAAGCTLGRASHALAAANSNPNADSDSDAHGPARPGPIVYGVQLYMVRRQAVKDLAGVLRAIHQIGYAQIELFPIAYPHPAPELRRMVADAGLAAAAGHFDYVGFESRIDYAHQLGLEYMVCPSLPGGQRTVEGFNKAAADFNLWGKRVHEAGMQFAFHNHDYEFKPLGNTTGFGELIKHTDPALVKLELDLYWLIEGGQIPMAMLVRHADRVRLLHLKDRPPSASAAPAAITKGKESERFTELGKGTIEWPSLLAQARSQGIRYAFVDQDETAGPVLESLEESYAYLRTLKP